MKNSFLQQKEENESTLLLMESIQIHNKQQEKQIYEKVELKGILGTSTTHCCP
jgi:UDP-glucose 6-dehydrogenase